MKKKNYQKPTATVISVVGADELMEKGNIPFGSIEHTGGRKDAKEHSLNLWEDDEDINPNNTNNE